MIEEVKLFSRGKEDAVEKIPFTGYSDISYDEKGNWIRCQGEEGLEQSLVKGILTSPQGSYGTRIKSFLGKKNLSFIRGNLLVDILSTINFLKSNQNLFLINFPSFNPKSIFNDIYSLIVNKVSKSGINIDFSIDSLYDKQRNNGNRMDLGTTLKK